MTNKEKFKEVFGLEIDDTSDCGFFDCTDREECKDCPVKNTKDWWNSEYRRNVFDKIKEEIERQEKWLIDAGYNAYNVDLALDAIKLAVAESEGE